MKQSLKRKNMCLLYLKYDAFAVSTVLYNQETDMKLKIFIIEHHHYMLYALWRISSSEADRDSGSDVKVAV